MKIIKKYEKKRLCIGLSHHEFRCSCSHEGCRATLVHPDLLKSFEYFRKCVDTKLIIDSGYRCPQHNKDIGGSERSRHTSGQAIDISYHSLKDKFSVTEIEQIAQASGFTFILWYNQLEFFHFDVR